MGKFTYIISIVLSLLVSLSLLLNTTFVYAIDSSLSADSNTILQYTENNITFSDAQEFLGEINCNGEITAVDSKLVLQIITTQI